MKITFMCPHLDLAGGVRVIAIYADRLKKMGHDVLVVSRPKPKPTIKKQFRSLKAGKGLIIRKKEPSHFDNVMVDHKMIGEHRAYQESDFPDADVIIATWWKTAEEISGFSRCKGAKVYFIQLHETFKGQPIDRVKKTYTSPLHKITISKPLVDLMREEYGDFDVSVVPNSVDRSQFCAPKRSKQAVPTIGFLYTPTFHKGCDIVFKAIEMTSRDVHNIKLVAFGKAKPSLTLPLPAGTAYSYQPDQSKIKDIYAQCDVWLCGSRREGFHLPPLEAMACRTPVVSTAVGGPIDTIEDGSNGYLVPVEDHKILSKRLTHVLTMDNSEWESMSEAAYNTSVKYTWDDAAKRFELALEKAIEKEAANLSESNCPSI
ncbi:MAG: glycosyltransferase family 4 protein [Elainellaceae cyanobacterium]